MNALLTNDDGVFSPGLWALHGALRHLGDVTVVAPRTDQSGVGHAITCPTPITVERVTGAGSVPAYAVAGTPADCVKFALLEVFQEPPDLVVSGINLGMNLGLDVFYSGTVAAALEGAMCGILSAAFSTCTGNSNRLASTAAQSLRAVELILKLAGRRPGRALAYNVNVPALDDSDPGILLTHHRVEPLRERYQREEQNGMRGYRLLGFPGEDCAKPEARSDVQAVREGRISVTPLRAILTDLESLHSMDPSYATDAHPSLGPAPRTGT